MSVNPLFILFLACFHVFWDELIRWGHRLNQTICLLYRKLSKWRNYKTIGTIAFSRGACFIFLWLYCISLWSFCVSLDSIFCLFLVIYYLNCCFFSWISLWYYFAWCYSKVSCKGTNNLGKVVCVHHKCFSFFLLLQQLFVELIKHNQLYDKTSKTGCEKKQHSKDLDWLWQKRFRRIKIHILIIVVGKKK